jgi:hypothetical protein
MAWCAVLASSANLLQAVTPQYAGDVSTYVPEDEFASSARGLPAYEIDKLHRKRGI